jgi:peptidoglycan-N-acetylglucosamine deacetylase
MDMATEYAYAVSTTQAIYTTHMWWAGVAWQNAGFELTVIDGGGAEVAAVRSFAGNALATLINTLRDDERRAPDGLGVVVDSTSGLLDGHLTAAGLRVFRADPWLLPDRTAFGSAPAGALAQAGLTRPLPRLTVASGALIGRHEEYAADVARCASVEEDLARAGRYLTRGRPDAGAPVVALTFDDGPDPRFTPRVLDLLYRYGIRASFFCVGINVAAHPDLPARAAAEGHTVGNHTWSHPYLPDLTRDELLRQVDATSEALTSAVGQAGRLVRPPYGARTPDVLRWLAEHELTTVLWDVDAHDWAAPGAEAIVGAVTGAVGAGSVVLMHDGGGDRTQTVEALPGILRSLLDRGYTFATIDQLRV